MRTGAAGYTVMEVLVAMLIVAVGAGAAASTMVFTTDAVGESTMRHDAIVLAQKSVERLRTIAYSDIDSGSETSADGTYSVTRDVLFDTPELGMKSITVTVSWQWKGEPRSYVLHTVFARLTKS